MLLLQKPSLSFLFILDAMKSEKNAVDSKPSELLRSILHAWSQAIRADLYFYLQADKRLLGDRFNNRKDGKDHIHRPMMMKGDAELPGCIRGSFSIGIQEIDNSGSVKEATSKIAERIRDKLAEKRKGAQGSAVK